jgi:carbohydrate-selective porin OprB
VIPAYAIVKKAAALVNHRAGRLGDTQKDLIVRVCDEILAGQHQDQFPLHVWMTGIGTQFNAPRICRSRCGLRVVQRRAAPRGRGSGLDRLGRRCADWEITIELRYGCTVRPGLVVGPSVQYLVNPGGNRTIPNALAIGATVIFNF